MMDKLKYQFEVLGGEEAVSKLLNKYVARVQKAEHLEAFHEWCAKKSNKEDQKAA